MQKIRPTRINFSLTPTLGERQAIQKWNGTLPTVTGGAMPFVDVTPAKPQPIGKALNGGAAISRARGSTFVPKVFYDPKRPVPASDSVEPWSCRPHLPFYATLAKAAKGFARGSASPCRAI